MKQIHVATGAVLMLLLCSLLGQAQQTVAPATNVIVPPLVNFNGILADGNGKPLTGVVGVTFYLYKEQQGGAPLWMETQNVQPDKSGHYMVLLGSATSQGLPANIFTTGEAHWLGVQVEGQAEQPRVLLLSVPYALKAGDAETVGGLPPSAFVLAAPASGRATPASISPAAVGPASVGPALGGTGTTDFIPLWTDSTGDLGNSVMFQSGAGSTAKVGINTTAPISTLDVGGTTTIRGALRLPVIGLATASAGKNSQPLDWSASVFNSSTSTPVTQTFQWQAEPAGNNTASPSGTLNLLYGTGTSTPGETGLSIAGNGLITFAGGQTFPATGTITGVTAGTDLTGGGSTGSVTLNLDTTKVPQLAASNTFTANQTVSGAVTATSFAGNGAGVTNVNASMLGGLAPSAYAQLAAANTFTGQQTINNTTIMTGTNTAGVLQVTNTVTSGKGPAIVGTTNSSAAAGVKGIITAVTGTEAGVFGLTASPTGYGVHGSGAQAISGVGNVGGAGVGAFGGSSNGGPSQGGPGVYAVGGTGVLTADRGGVGVYAYGGDGGTGGGGDGIYATAGSPGILCTVGSSACVDAGYFNGDVNVTGLLTKGSGSFKIDHPLDPANKYLFHSFVESPDMMNIYNGNVTTDGTGSAIVTLPDWFETLNRDFRYQLTVIGQFAQAIVDSKIANGRFTIKTDKPGVEVSWQVTGIRQDAWANAHRIPVEVEKDPQDQGHYLHPELFGHAGEPSIAEIHHPRPKAPQP